MTNHFLQCTSCLPYCYTAWGWGDPHITTVDGLQFTFNGLGEYRMLESDDQSFKFQVPTLVGNGINATEFKALTIILSSNNNTIEVQVYLYIHNDYYHCPIIE